MRAICPPAVYPVSARSARSCTSRKHKARELQEFLRGQAGYNDHSEGRAARQAHLIRRHHTFAAPAGELVGQVNWMTSADARSGG
jgi:hypothetical protein